MTIWSLGQSRLQASCVFTDTEPFTIVGGGPSAEFGGNPITKSGNTVFGNEGNGTIVFNGTFSALSWTNPQFENWYGFDIGVTGAQGPSVPEPATLLLLGSGLTGLVAMRRFGKKD